MIEVEAYRRLAERALDRPVAEVVAPDAWYLKRDLTAAALSAAVTGRSFVTARRIGKLLLLDTDGDGPTVGLRFGMTGHLLVDGSAGVEDLRYGSTRDETAWDRVTFRFDDGGDLRVRDARRLGGVMLDPDEARLGTDATRLTLGQLRTALQSDAPLKARLMDQARLAGLGNLLVDEVLFRAGLDPARPARSLGDAEQRRLHRRVRGTVDELFRRGGSHTGDLMPARMRGGMCPKDGAPLERRTIGGRTTWSCPVHQH